MKKRKIVDVSPPIIKRHPRDDVNLLGIKLKPRTVRNRSIFEPEIYTDPDSGIDYEWVDGVGWCEVVWVD